MGKVCRENTAYLLNAKIIPIFFCGTHAKIVNNPPGLLPVVVFMVVFFYLMNTEA